MRACHQFVATIALVALLSISQQLLVVVSAAPQIQHIIAPRQSTGGGPALNFKGNTAWPYGLCEVSFEPWLYYFPLQNQYI